MKKNNKLITFLQDKYTMPLTAVLYIFIRAIRTLMHPVTGKYVRNAIALTALKLVIGAVGHSGTPAAIRKQCAAWKTLTLHLCPLIQLTDILTAPIENTAWTGFT